MRLIQELPEVEKIIEKGELSLSNVVAAQVHFRAEQKAGSALSVEDKLEVIECLKNKSARQGEKILKEKASVEPLPVRDSIRQVTATVSEVRFGADEKLLEMMAAVKGRLAHKHPRLGTKELMEIVFTMALESLDPVYRAKQRTEAKEKVAKPTVKTMPMITKDKTMSIVSEAKAEVKKMPKFSPPTLAALVKKGINYQRKHISIKIKREVWKDAGNRCVNCKSNYALETDHRTPVSLGGSSTRENLRLLCRNCNQREAIKKLGQYTMDPYLT